MRRALCAVAALAAMTFVPSAVRGEERTAALGEKDVPVTTAVYQPDEQSSNVRLVDYGYRYGYGSPYYRYSTRYPSYGYRYGYRYPTYYNYQYPTYTLPISVLRV